MLIKCNKCGFENQLGAIFCRGCGEKIETKDIDPTALEEGARKSRAARRKINWKPILGLVLLAAVVTLGILMFSKPANTPDYVKNEDELKLVKKMVKSIENGVSTSMTPSQITTYFNEELINHSNSAAGGASYTVHKVVFTGTGSDLTVTIYTTVLSCETVLTVTGTLKKGSAENPVDFQLKEFHFGKLKMPFAQEAILSKFNGIFYCDKIKNLFRDAQAAEFKDGALHLVLSKKRIKSSR